MRHHLLMTVFLTPLFVENTGRWAVWLGRHALEKISSAPKGRLRWDRDPP